MVFVLLISIPIVWELLQRDENAAIRTLRLIVALTTIICMVGAAYIKEYLAKRELSSNIRIANEKLHLALQAASTVVWECDLRTGKGLWFGDLRMIFGISSETYAATIEELIERLHPDDRKQFSEALVRAQKSREPYAVEFRLKEFDGTSRWLIARGKFYYTRNGDPQRMLGMVGNIARAKAGRRSTPR
jgi:hypothetical protein